MELILEHIDKADIDDYIFSREVPHLEYQDQILSDFFDFEMPDLLRTFHFREPSRDMAFGSAVSD
jgi:hypothetical protein